MRWNPRACVHGHQRVCELVEVAGTGASGLGRCHSAEADVCTPWHTTCWLPQERRVLPGPLFTSNCAGLRRRACPLKARPAGLR